MKILNCKQQKEADAYTIEHEGILSINLMEKAAGMLTEAITRRWDKSHRIVVFAGPEITEETHLPLPACCS